MNPTERIPLKNRYMAVTSHQIARFMRLAHVGLVPKDTEGRHEDCEIDMLPAMNAEFERPLGYGVELPHLRRRTWYRAKYRFAPIQGKSTIGKSRIYSLGAMSAIVDYCEGMRPAKTFYSLLPGRMFPSRTSAAFEPLLAYAMQQLSPEFAVCREPDRSLTHRLTRVAHSGAEIPLTEHQIARVDAWAADMLARKDEIKICKTRLIKLY